jgi:hypothetical protein
MEAERTLPNLLEPIPQIDQSTPPSHFLKIHINIMLPSTPEFSSGRFPSGFPTKTLYAPLLYPHVSQASPFSFFSI